MIDNVHPSIPAEIDMLIDALVEAVHDSHLDSPLYSQNTINAKLDLRVAIAERSPIIPAPKPETDISDGTLDCEFAMEPAFQALAEAAERAGWAAADVASALVNLADNHMLARAANAETDAMIERVRKGK